MSCFKSVGDTFFYNSALILGIDARGTNVWKKKEHVSPRTVVHSVFATLDVIRYSWILSKSGFQSDFRIYPILSVYSPSIYREVKAVDAKRIDQWKLAISIEISYFSDNMLHRLFFFQRFLPPPWKIAIFSKLKKTQNFFPIAQISLFDSFEFINLNFTKTKAKNTPSFVKFQDDRQYRNISGI